MPGIQCYLLLELIGGWKLLGGTSSNPWRQVGTPQASSEVPSPGSITHFSKWVTKQTMVTSPGFGRALSWQCAQGGCWGLWGCVALSKWAGGLEFLFCRALVSTMLPCQPESSESGRGNWDLPHLLGPVFSSLPVVLEGQGFPSWVCGGCPSVLLWSAGMLMGKKAYILQLPMAAAPSPSPQVSMVCLQTQLHACRGARAQGSV